MTTTKEEKRRTIPWLRYSDEVYEWLESRLTDNRAHTVNGTPVRRELVGRSAPQVSRPAVVTTSGATAPMTKLIDDLLVERQYTVLTTQQIDDIKKNKAQASRFIKFLLGLPRVQAQPVVEAPVVAPVAPARARLDFSIIPDGNYALPGEGDEIKFYRVSRNGQWVNVQIRASDSLFPVKGRQGIAVLHKIVEYGLAESQMLFATKLERCYKCGRSLTNEVSRARGTGDECASK